MDKEIKLAFTEAYIGVSDEVRDGERFVVYEKYNPKVEDQVIDTVLEVDGVPVDAVIKSDCCDMPTFSQYGDDIDVVRCEKCGKICNSYLDKKDGN